MTAPQQAKVIIPQWTVSLILGALISLFGWLTNRAIKQIDTEITTLKTTALTERVFQAEKAALKQEISDLKEELKDVKRQSRWRER